jgi:pimeloyl-ACP methyl ester carboxylesterase
VTSVDESPVVAGERFAVADDGVRLHYRRSGSGECVVLVGGTSCNLGVWDAQWEPLTAAHDVIAMDTRGAGQSDQPADPEAYSVGRMAADVMAVLDDAGVDRAHVVGHSLGGAIALRAALDFPDRVASAVLHAAWAATDDLIEGMFFRPMMSFLSAEDRYGAFKLGQALVMSHDYLRTRGPSPVADLVRRNFVKPEHPASTPGFVGHLVAGRAHDERTRLADVRCPVLVVVGERDLNVPVSYSEDLAETVPGAELVVLRGPRSSHFIQWEMAEEFTSAVTSFLSSHPFDQGVHT